MQSHLCFKDVIYLSGEEGREGEREGEERKREGRTK